MYLAALRQFCRWLADRRLLDWPRGQMALLRGFRVDTGFARDSLTEEKLRALLRTFPVTAERPKLREIQLRDYAIAVLWSAVGLRSIELARAQRGDLGMEEGEHVLKLHRKGRDTVEEDKFVVLKDWVFEPLARYLDLHDHSHPGHQDAPEHHPLFVAVGPSNRYDSASPMCDPQHAEPLDVKSIQNMMRRHLGLAGLRHLEIGKTKNRRPISPHSLRHSAASIALAKGASAKQVQDMLGHANIETTMLYVHNKDRVKQAAEGFIPKLTEETELQ